MRTHRKQPLLRGILALLAVAAVGTALAAKPATPPTIDEIVGQYAVSSKYVEFDFCDGGSWKGSCRDTFVITKTGGNTVQVTWSGDWGTADYDGTFANGVVTVALGDGVTPPAYMELLILQFSGTPGKIKLTGKYFWYEWNGCYLDSETLKGKQTPD